jgi:hypothetical protein
VGAGWDAATRQKAALPAHDHQIKPRSWWTPETQSVIEGTGSIPGLSISVHGKGVHNKEPQQRQRMNICVDEHLLTVSYGAYDRPHCCCCVLSCRVAVDIVKEPGWPVVDKGYKAD